MGVPNPWPPGKLRRSSLFPQQKQSKVSDRLTRIFPSHTDITFPAQDQVGLRLNVIVLLAAANNWFVDKQAEFP